MRTVSVIMASYNHGRFLRTNLESLLAQSTPPHEVMVVDDGSSDGSLTILREYERSSEGRVRCFTHPGGANRGMYASLNLAYKASAGDVIAVQGSDDFWHREKLERQLQLLSVTQAGAVYSRAYRVNESGGIYLGPDGRPGCFGHLADSILPALMAFNVVPAMTLIFRRSALGMATVPFREELLFGDWELNIRLAASVGLEAVARPLAYYRRHPQAATSAARMVKSGIAHRRALTKVVLSDPLIKERPDYALLRRQARRGGALHALHLAGLAASLGLHRWILSNLFAALAYSPTTVLKERRQAGAAIARLCRL